MAGFSTVVAFSRLPIDFFPRHFIFVFRRDVTHNDVGNAEFSWTFNIPPFLLPYLSGSLRANVFQISLVDAFDNISNIFP